MEALMQLSVGIYTLALLKPPPARRPLLKPSAAVSGGTTTSKWADRLVADFQFLPSTSDSTDSTTCKPPPPLPSLPERYVSMPLDFYQVLGAESHFLGDGIRRAYNARVAKPPQFGFSDDALISRRQILRAACETLADSSSRREYNQGLADDEFDTILTKVPWEKDSSDDRDNEITDRKMKTNVNRDEDGTRNRVALFDEDAGSSVAPEDKLRPHDPH